MSEPAKVFEDRVTPGQWRVEWFDDDGRSEVEIFTGPTARKQALRYAMQKYGHFREVELEPYPTETESPSRRPLSHRVVGGCVVVELRPAG
jgi:hypothetical protein